MRSFAINQIVVLVSMYDRVFEVVKIAKEVLGNKYSEYTWFYGSRGVYDILSYVPDDDPDVLSSLEHWTGVAATFSEEKASTLE
eukprot:scaffold154944_cov51-Prasinocladus_malaysianus.AAC.1